MKPENPQVRRGNFLFYWLLGVTILQIATFLYFSDIHSISAKATAAVKCPKPSENPAFLGCRNPADANRVGGFSTFHSVIKGDYSCPGNTFCYVCEDGFVKDSATSSCVVKH